VEGKMNMQVIETSLRRSAVAFAVTLAAATALFAPRSVLAQAAEPKTAEQVFKNITQLKGTPADQLQPAMQFISASLGVDCAFCHVQGQFDSDDKPTKKTARSMIAMQDMINKNSFNGRKQVTCFSCHRGAANPVGMPPVLEADAAPKPAPAAAPPAGGAPNATADQILEKYVTALGGADAIHKVTSRVMKGKILTNGNESAIELYAKAPNQRVSVSHSGTGESFTAFDGTAGWMGNTGRPARDMAAAESQAAGLDAEFYLALRLKEMYPQLRRGRPETIAGAECETLQGNSPNYPSVRLSFDKQSGLLVRIVRYADNPLGRMPTQIDYADYRDAGGAKIPYRWTLSRPNGRFTIQIDTIQTNVPIEASKFAKPTGEIK
jgi:photosynthetic reaction center cytochrome c subunit